MIHEPESVVLNKFTVLTMICIHISSFIGYIVSYKQKHGCHHTTQPKLKFFQSKQFSVAWFNAHDLETHTFPPASEMDQGEIEQLIEQQQKIMKMKISTSSAMPVQQTADLVTSYIKPSDQDKECGNTFDTY